MADTLTFVLDGWELPSAGQQLLDRFLLGYAHEGARRRPAFQVRLCPIGPMDAALLEPRQARGLQVEADLGRSLAEARGVVVGWKPPGDLPNDSLLQAILSAAPAMSRCFVAGPLCRASSIPALKPILDERTISLQAGSALNVTWHLPPLGLPSDATLTEALVVVQGTTRKAAWEGLEALAPVLHPRAGGETTLEDVTAMTGEEIWNAGKQGRWSWDLLAAALSRSDAPQGDPVRDGRTQDLVGLGLVPGLTRDPRGWLLRHRNGLRTCILVLDGVVADCNLAVRTRDQDIRSCQVLQAARPAQEEYSLLAHLVERFLLGDQAPGSLEQSLWIASALDQMAKG